MCPDKNRDENMQMGLKILKKKMKTSFHIS